MDESFQIVGKTLAGLEAILAGELVELGAKQVKLGVRLVSFRGDRRLLYRANLWSRAAIRFLRPIAKFAATNEQELYQGISAIDWRQYLDVDSSLAIDPVVRSSFCTHSLYAAQLAKDAIVDQIRGDCGKRPSVDLRDPDLRINLHMNRNRVTVHLDSSGDSLHKRGYRNEAGDAPINEVLAAGILSLTGWDRAMPLVDPMCGSGTFLIEAARWARQIAPGILRPFAFERWKDYDRALHDELDKEARAAAQPCSAGEIVGSDWDRQVVEIARRNASLAGVADTVRIERADFSDITPPQPPGIVVVNPPYDERLKVDAIAKLYRRLGDALKRRFSGYTAFVFTGNPDAAKPIGLRLSDRRVLYNGPIECRLLRYDIRGRAAKASVCVPRGAIADGEPTRPGIEYVGSLPRLSAGAEPAGTAASIDSDRVMAAGGEPPAVGGRVHEQLEMFSNRLRRMSRHWRKWARRQGISCFRVYDRDIPDVPLSIDCYADRLHIAEFERPHARSESEHADWLRSVVDTARQVLDVPPERVYFKRHRRQRGTWQYSRLAERNEWFEVTEGGHRFLVNLADYLDTGLFLDHRITRSMVKSQAAGSRFLNLFAYTGSFTVYAAAGGAISTTTVDLSATYLDWARRNMRLNGWSGPEHEFVCDDSIHFLRVAAGPLKLHYDLAVVDPPTFSNSKSLEHDFDVQRDHVSLIEQVLALMKPAGRVYFSTNRRKFRFDADRIGGCTIKEISGQTIPLDFQRKRPHRCWLLERDNLTATPSLQSLSRPDGHSR